MKKLFRAVLCAGLLALTMSIPAFAAQGSAPAKQGDFYVLVNGSYVTFADAVPKIRDSRSCLPFATTFEQLGFGDIKWDGETKTVTADRGDVAVAMTIGEKEIRVTEEGKTKTVAADVAPYIDASTNRTYVPFGLVADALGYKVCWDSTVGAVIIDDVDAILAGNDATYTLMDQYMAYSKQFAEKPYQVTGNMNADMKTDIPEAGKAEAAVKGTYNMLMNGMDAFQFKTEMNVTATGEDPMTVDMDMRGNLTSGVFYLQSAALAEAMEQPGMANAWYKLDLAGLFDQMGQQMGMSYASLLEMSRASLEMSFTEYLETALRTVPVTGVDDTTADVLKVLNQMLSDSAFKKSGSTYVSTFEQDGAKMTMTLYTSGNQVTGYAIDLDALGIMKMTASMRGDKLAASVEMKVDDMVAMTLTMDGTYKATSSKPSAEPPANASIVDLTQQLGLAA